LYSPILGHVGDGNFHLTIFIDPNDMGGSYTEEHGIGLSKLKHMRAEHGDGAVNMMRTIQKAIDPDNIMNPSKTIDC
jgi:D-lactate dehydrogenase (cytochrome)|tara:strand:+ start:971 stop:1201 length:231 start_codon:yes stop_codon:yes gene_type:complete